MKWLALSIFCISQMAFAVTSDTTTPVHSVRVASTASFYNHSFQTTGALVAFVTEKNKTKGEELAAHMNAQKIEMTAKMPRLLIVDDHLEVEGHKGEKFYMTPNSFGGIKITYGNMTTNVNVTMTLSEMQAAFKAMGQTSSMMDFFVPTAQAQDFASSAALTVGSFGVDLTSVVYGTTYAGEEAEFSIRKKIRNLFHSMTRDDATEACEKAQAGKEVKNAEKIIGKLEKMKKEIECIQWWPATSTGSCAWYDEKIACIKDPKKATKGDDSSRKNVKPNAPVESSSTSSSSKKGSSQTK